MLYNDSVRIICDKNFDKILLVNSHNEMSIIAHLDASEAVELANGILNAVKYLKEVRLKHA